MVTPISVYFLLQKYATLTNIDSSLVLVKTPIKDTKCMIYVSMWHCYTNHFPIKLMLFNLSININCRVYRPPMLRMYKKICSDKNHVNSQFQSNFLLFPWQSVSFLIINSITEHNPEPHSSSARPTRVKNLQKFKKIFKISIINV